MSQRGVAGRAGVGGAIEGAGPEPLAGGTHEGTSLDSLPAARFMSRPLIFTPIVGKVKFPLPSCSLHLGLKNKFTGEK